MSDLAAALVAALKDLHGVEKGRTAKVKMKQGGEYTYSYANIADVIEATRPALASNGLVALTPVHAHEDGLACTVEILHTSGESKLFPPLSFPHGADAQATGSAITYFRRYALLAALGMAAEDDDGAGATERPRAQGNESGRVARGQSSGATSGATGPTEAQAKFIRKLSGGDDALVRSVVQEIHGSEIELADLPKREVSKVIDELKEVAKQSAKSDVVADRDATAEQKAVAGEEPF